MCGSRLCPEWTGHLGVMELFADLHPTPQVSVLATQPLMGSGKQSMEKVGKGGREGEGGRQHQIGSQEAGFWLLAVAFKVTVPCWASAIGGWTIPKSIPAGPTQLQAYTPCKPVAVPPKAHWPYH